MSQLDDLATATASRPRRSWPIPDYAGIRHGSVLIRVAASVLGLLSIAPFGLGMLLLAAAWEDGGLGGVVWGGPAVLLLVVGVQTLLIAVLLELIGHMAKAMRDVAQNSFRVLNRL